MKLLVEMRPSVGLLIDVHQFAVIHQVPVPQSQRADGNTTRSDTIQVCTLPTAVQIYLEETLRKFNLIVLVSIPADQSDPHVFWRRQISCENKWTSSGPRPTAVIQQLLLLF